jgi:hypothetical protein
MAYEVKDMTGSAFQNRRKTEDRHADLTGEAKIFGRDVWVNVWKKKDKNGNTYISIGFREKQERMEEQRPVPKQQVVDDSEIPF